MCAKVYTMHDQGGVCGQRITIYDFKGSPIASPKVDCKKRPELYVNLALCAKPCMLDPASVCCFVPAEIAWMYPCCRKLGCCPDQNSKSSPVGSRRALGQRSSPSAPRGTPAVSVSVSVEETSSSSNSFAGLMTCLKSPTSGGCKKTPKFTLMIKVAGAGRRRRRRRRAQSATTGQCEHGGRPTASAGCAIAVAGLLTFISFDANACGTAVAARLDQWSTAKPKTATFAFGLKLTGGFTKIPTTVVTVVDAGRLFAVSCNQCTWPTMFTIAGVLNLNGTTMRDHTRSNGGAIVIQKGGNVTTTNSKFLRNKAVREVWRETTCVIVP